METSKTHDILKKIGKPMMLGGSVAYVITDSKLARTIGIIGCCFTASWFVVDVADTMEERRSK